jgi:molybdate transport system permease protein
MDPSTLFPIALSIRVSLFAVLLVTPPGLCVALVQARGAYSFRRLVDAIVLLPLVLPPSVVGYVLVLIFGRRGVLGSLLDTAFGVRLGFTPAAAVLASAVVAFPLLVKTAQPAIESVPRALEDVARTLGLSPAEVLLRVTLPSAWRGVVAAVVIAFARALGEFGATLMFAGDIPGRTNTMPLEIYSSYLAGDDSRALLYVVVLTVVSFLVVLTAGRAPPRVS